ncbi:MAG: NAD-glutamate dehydrogenase [Proteobacteria bacterium]|nr:NAD-glutamate dehydrogenase [Pseudomonadota bacterium]
MTAIRVDSKPAFYLSLERRIRKRGGTTSQLKFAQSYYSQVPLSELLQKSWQTVIHALYSSWKFYQKFDGTRSQVRVFNPTIEDDGFETRQTVIEVTAANLPFLLDSIRLMLNSESLILSDVQQCMLSAIRSGNKAPVIVDDRQPNETLIHLEIERVSNPVHLERMIRKVLKLVHQVNKDFVPMRQQMLTWSGELGTGLQLDGKKRKAQGSNGEEETVDFLRWLSANNFTFLGYEEFILGKRGSDVQRISSSSLGLCRKGMPVNGLAFQVSGRKKYQLLISKLPVRSKVHRSAYYESITIVRPGNTSGTRRACRFVGLFTSSAYNQNPVDIPVVRRKIEKIFEHQDLTASSHKGRVLSRIIEIFPRDELFLATSEELEEMVLASFALQERRVVRLLVRRSKHFVSCLLYMPRDTYNTQLRIKIQAMLSQQFTAVESEFSTFFSESALTRTHFVLRVNPEQQTPFNLVKLEQEITRLTRSWEDELQWVLSEMHINNPDANPFHRYGRIFPPGYQDFFTPQEACFDISFLSRLTTQAPLAVNLYEAYVVGSSYVKFKVFHLGDALPLSDVIPILENLGAKTVSEHPYELRLSDDARVWIHDFALEFRHIPVGGLQGVKQIFEEAFHNIWREGKENDSFNRLVPSAAMNFRQVKVIRAYSRYFAQLQSTYSQQYIADCLTRYSKITKQLWQMFELRLDPALDRESALAKAARMKRQILSNIDKVENLADDRILRRFIEMIQATLRTNYFQRKSDGSYKDCIAFKFRPSEISEMPLPTPEYEIFVYSVRIEGVHLRGGKVARGGLRWSDRSEDYRTEILGLVKAQQVKNSVIVPVGAKGGFLTKQIPDGASAEVINEEGIACYRIFIQGLLDLTDNLVKGEVVPPQDVVRYDDDDYYLVVAADKGTGGFSDIANEISEANNFWLGDAFASGGSVGYDHKAMGITAKGAWKSVAQHFRDLDLNVQESEFTVIGIGDMSGDVFGNGMLLSRHICLVAAFNHLHIFIDPDPIAARSYKERLRLFNLPGSSWQDYQQKIISKGGGVFSRLAKSISISPQMRKRFDISATSLTPNQLLTSLLRSDVDLLWNGGIGTYVKCSRESHLDVSDKANDAIRVNADELRCRVVGEGGNLGLTQLARIEYNLKGGKCFTDFIDNAGGVNCSDVEVNIKILLNQLLEDGKLSRGERKKILKKMTEQVAEIVLNNNYMQAQAINLMVSQSPRRSVEYPRIISLLEEQGRLNRKLEFLPSDDELQERRANGQYLTGPELSVLTSYVKAGLKEDLASSSIMDDPYMRKELDGAFPAYLVRKYSKELDRHRLRRELIATRIANDMVNHLGMNFVGRMEESTGANSALIARAYIGARDVFDFSRYWTRICELDYIISPDVQRKMMLDLIRLIRRVTRWLLRSRRHSLNLAKEVPVFSKALKILFMDWQELLRGETLHEWKSAKKHLVQAGVEPDLAGFVAAAHHLYAVMGILELSRQTGASVKKVADVYFTLGENLHLHWFSKQMHDFQATNLWQALARESLQDDLNRQQLAITLGVLSEGKKGTPAAQIIDNWLDSHHLMVNRWMNLQAEMAAAKHQDQAVFTVAIRELLDLAQSSRVVTR